jgi:hypothetical protein
MALLLGGCASPLPESAVSKPPAISGVRLGMTEADARRLLPKITPQQGYVLLEQDQGGVSAEVCSGTVQSVRQTLGTTLDDYVRELLNHKQLYGEPRYTPVRQLLNARTMAYTSYLEAEWSFHPAKLTLVLYESSSDMGVWRMLISPTQCGGWAD